MIVRRLSIALVCALTAACTQSPPGAGTGGSLGDLPSTPAHQTADRYQLEQDSLGRMFRLDKQTGEVAVLENGRLVPIITPTEAATLAAPKDWSIVASGDIGVESAYLRTRWSEGFMDYQLSFGPVPQNWEDETDRTFTVVLRNTFGSVVISVPLSHSDLYTLVEESGQETGLLAGGRVACSPRQYLETLEADDWSLLSVT